MAYVPTQLFGGFNFIDQSQQVSLMRFRLPEDFDVSDPDDLYEDLYNASQAISYAAIKDRRIYLDDPVDVYTALDGAYEDVEDKAVLLFSSPGQTVRVEVPAPQAGIFEGDKETVDPLDPLIAAFVSAFVALAVNVAGEQLIDFIRGYRKRARMRDGKPGVPTG